MLDENNLCFENMCEPSKITLLSFIKFIQQNSISSYRYTLFLTPVPTSSLYMWKKIFVLLIIFDVVSATFANPAG